MEGAAAKSGSAALAAAVGVSLVLAALKYGFGVYSGSLVLLSSAADSFSDAVVSGINWWGYRWARSPADPEHRFGHGKLEAVLATGQGALLIGIAASIIAAAIKSLFDQDPAPRALIAAATLVGSTASAGFLGWLLTRAQRRTRSLVLQADAAHYRTDLAAGAAGVASLGLVAATGWAWVDPIAAIGAAAWMTREAIMVLGGGINELLDRSLPAEEEAIIARVLDAHREDVIEFHGLRSRKSGPTRFVEVHVVLPPERPLAEVHRLVQRIAEEIRGQLPGSRVMVHPDAAGSADTIDLVLEGHEPR